jgi:4-oxalocrotonate tautomerase
LPVITIKMGKNQANNKSKLIEKLTSAATEVTNIPASSYTVFIEEWDLDSIGVGGQTLAEKFAK